MNKTFPFKSFIVFLFFGTFLLSAQSPYKISVEKDSYILGAGSAAGIIGVILDHNVQPLSSADVSSVSRESVNWFDRNATYHYSIIAGTTSDILFGIAAAAPFALFIDQDMRNDWRALSLMYLETWSFIGGSTLLAKGSAFRIRPFVYNIDASMDQKLTSDARKSFFSGHATAAFASAVFLSTIYSDYNPSSQWRPYIWTCSLLTAGVIGYLRYEAGAHFPTDIFVGALVGSAIGYMIPWMHRVGKNGISVTPLVPGADFGFSMQVKF